MTMPRNGFVLHLSTPGRVRIGDRVEDHRHGMCTIVCIPDLFSLIVRRESDGQYLNFSGLYWGQDVRLVNRAESRDVKQSEVTP